ncbi:MAG: SpoIIE family protein phosphatase [Bacteroidales bacterium]|nr:SpoIIE family protein phosphatase [Bacteroidales bacterium]
MRIYFIICFVITFICNIGDLFAQTKKQSKQIIDIQNQLKKANDNNKISLYNKLSDIYLQFDNNKALENIQESEKLCNKTNANYLLYCDVYDQYATCYYNIKDYKTALKYYDKELELLQKNNNRKLIGLTYFNQAVIYKELDKYKKAITGYSKSLAYAKDLKDNNLQIQCYKALYDIYKDKEYYQEALNNYIEYINLVSNGESRKNKSKISLLTRQYSGEKTLRIKAEETVEEKDLQLNYKDSLINEVATKNTNLEQDTARKAQEIALLNAQKQIQEQELVLKKQEVQMSLQMIEKQRSIIILFVVIAIIVIGFIVVLYLMLKKIKRINIELEFQKDEIEQQKNLIEQKNCQITDSINYARKIQDNILVPESKLKQWLPQMFIYFKPKDIVSGDFYWFSKFENKYVITAIDCTGHGVPGAFLSMVGNTLLHEIVNIKHIFKPDEILTMLHTGIRLALNQDSEDSGSEDGMDMSLCTVDTKQHRFQFAGAKNNLYVVQGDKLKILKANYYSIGGKLLRPDMKVEFTCYDFMYDENTSIYMFSDGYLDQFGGEDNEKFNTQRFREMILANRKLPMEQQKAILSETMQKWIGNRQQIDDFLVMGVKLSDLK